MVALMIVAFWLTVYAVGWVATSRSIYRAAIAPYEKERRRAVRYGYRDPSATRFHIGIIVGATFWPVFVAYILVCRAYRLVVMSDWQAARSAVLRARRKPDQAKIDALEAETADAEEEFVTDVIVPPNPGSVATRRNQDVILSSPDGWLRIQDGQAKGFIRDDGGSTGGVDFL
jgi:hypothetical protein